MSRTMDATQLEKSTGTASRAVQSDDREAILARGKAVLRAEAAAVGDAEDRLGNAFVDAARAILHCTGRVCVTGVGKAGLIGRKIQATLASTGTLSYALHPVEALHGDLGMLHADDVVLALSKSGSSELVELLPRLKAISDCRDHPCILNCLLQKTVKVRGDYDLDISFHHQLGYSFVGLRWNL